MSDPSSHFPAPSPARRRIALAVIFLGNGILSFGFQVWQSLFNNFAVQELNVQASGVGWIQSVREIPGILGVGIGLLALIFSEMHIAGLSLAMMGVGVALTGGVHSMVGLLIATFIMSVGFHFFMPANSAALLMRTEKRDAPRALGRLSSVGAMGALIGAAVVFVALSRVGFRALFYVTGALAIVGGLALLPWSGRMGQSALRERGARRGAAVRRRYWLYYLMEFLMGSRRHIFTTFAPFLLVKGHHISAEAITVLFVINNIAGTFLFPQFGKIIARFGERRTLTVNFALVILVFVGYAYIPSLAVLYTLFVADSLLFGFSIALQSYFQKIAVSAEDITPNLSLGQAINHIAAVFIPAVGGVVWEKVGSQYTFLIGAVIVTLSLISVQWMGRPASQQGGAE